jgi:shikimate kinase
MASLQQMHQQPRVATQNMHQRHVAPIAARAATVVQRIRRPIGGSISVYPNAFTSSKIITTKPSYKSFSSSRRCILISAVPPMGEEFEANNKQYAELTKQIESAAAIAQEGLGGTSLYLVGMMGSGKSTVGKLVSQALAYCFFDTDALIEQLAGKTIPEIFAEDGEEDFRAIETQVLMELAPFKDCIISTGGGAVTKSENWGHMQGGISVWLNGPPSLLAHRVMRDGIENRPLLASGGSGNASGDENASDNNSGGSGGGSIEQSSEEFQALLAKINKLMEDRLEQYSFADITVSLEGENPSIADFGAPAAVVALRILSTVNERIAKDAAARAERMNFEVVNETLPPTMQVVDSINPIRSSTPSASSDPDPYLP